MENWRGKRVDFHAHAVTEAFRRSMQALGIDPVAEDGFPLPAWNARDHVAFMDRAGVDVSVLSVSSPHLYSPDPRRALEAARRVNEDLAGVCRDRPDRFAFAASLPLPWVGPSLDELSRALDELGAVGVKVPSHMGEFYLGDPALDPVMEELDRRGALVILHPVGAQLRPRGGITGEIAPLFEYPADTTRAVLNLMARRTLTRFPRVRLVVPHCGSFLPYMLQRLIGLTQVLAGMGRMEEVDARAEFARLWFDIAGDAQPAALKSLLLVADRGRLVYGSDYPYTPGPAALEKKRGLEREDGALMEQLCRANAQVLLGAR